jgi:hypothetical protein
LDGRLEGAQFLVGFALEQIQRAYLPAIKAGAKDMVKNNFPDCLHCSILATD